MTANLTERRTKTTTQRRTDHGVTGAPTTNHQECPRRISTQELCLVTRQLATLVRAGMPLVTALAAASDSLHFSLSTQIIQWRDSPLSTIFSQICEDVRSGHSFSEALARHPQVFSDLYVNMVAAGEAAGTLDRTLQQLARVLEKRIHTTQKVKAALAYPVMMMAVALGVVLFLISYVVPSLTKVFAELNQTLPTITLGLMAVSSFMETHLLTLIIILTALGAGLVLAYRSPQGKLIWDRILLKIPVLGDLLLRVTIGRWARTLGTLLASGVPILTALEITKGVISNSLIRQGWSQVQDAVKHGENMADAIARARVFPPIVTHIVATGEASATLETALVDLADLCDDQVDTMTKTLTSLLEPAILLIMGVVVGFIALAILLPIFEINQTL